MKILLIEDDLDDIELLQEALVSHNVSFDLTTINDGAAAVTYIRDCHDCPDIIILDLNLPKVHGKEVILEIESLASFKNIPLLILTTSSARQDIDFAYAHGADKYLVKPTNSTQIKELVATIVQLSSLVKK